MTDRREFACFCCSYDTSGDHCKSCHAQADAEKESQADHDRAIEARVRAEVAEEIAADLDARAMSYPSVPIEGLDGLSQVAEAASALRLGADVARSHAGSSPDTTPEAKP